MWVAREKSYNMNYTRLLEVNRFYYGIYVSFVAMEDFRQTRYEYFQQMMKYVLRILDEEDFSLPNITQRFKFKLSAKSNNSSSAMEIRQKKEQMKREEKGI